ncbi:MAG: WD40 repeat domain-containing protein, partial [Planctomycetota bacterium]
ISFATPGTAGQFRGDLAHGSGVRDIAFSKDGSTLLSAGDDGNIVAWSVETNERAQTMSPHKGAVNQVEFIDNKRVISGGDDRRICLSNLEDGEHSILAVGKDTITAIAVSRNGDRFAAGFGNTRMLIGDIDDVDNAALIVLPDTYAVDLQFLEQQDLLIASLLSGRINLWNLPEIQSARTFRCVKGFGRFAIAPNTGRLILGAGDGSIEEIRYAHALIDEININAKSLNDAKIVDDGKAIVFCPDQGPAQIIHLASGRRLRSIPDYADRSVPPGLKEFDLLCVDESADNSKLAFGSSSGQVLVWNVADGKLRVLGHSRDRGILAVRFIGDGAELVSGGEDGAVRRWDLSHPNESTEITRHGGVIRGLELSPEGQQLLSIAADGSASLLETTTWAEQKRIETQYTLQSLAWSHDSKTVAMGDSQGGVLIYPASLSGDPTRLVGHAGPVTSVTFASSNKTLVSGGSDDDVRFWDLLTGQTKIVMTIHDRNIRALSLSRDGDLLMTADAGGLIRMWPAGSISPDARPEENTPGSSH